MCIFQVFVNHNTFAKITEEYCFGYHTITILANIQTTPSRVKGLINLTKNNSSINIKVGKNTNGAIQNTNFCLIPGNIRKIFAFVYAIAYIYIDVIRILYKYQIG